MLGAVVWTGWLGPVAGAAPAAPAAGPPPTPVQVALAVQRELAPVMWVAGAVESRRDARVSAEISGRLLAVADVGSVVAKGGELARIDDALLRIQKSEADAAIASAGARVKFLAQEVGRLTRLAQQNSTAQSQLDQTVADRDVAESALAVARAKLAEVDELLARAQIRAPFPGVVAERLLQAGEWVESGDPVARLVDTGALEIRARVSRDAMAFIAPGATVVVASGAERAGGKVRTLVPVGDPKSRQIEMRLDVTPGSWLVGQPVRVSVPAAAPRRVVAVHRDALVIRRAETVVFRVGADDTAERVPVVVGVAQDDFIEVTGAVQPGDRIVIRGGERMRPGQKVRLFEGGTSQ